MREKERNGWKKSMENVCYVKMGRILGGIWRRNVREYVKSG